MQKNEKTGSSSSKEGTVVTGVVVEALPNTLFKVSLAGDKEMFAYLSGKMRLNRIRVLVGDKVEIFLDVYGGKGRIIRRL